MATDEDRDDAPGKIKPKKTRGKRRKNAEKVQKRCRKGVRFSGSYLDIFPARPRQA